MRTSDSEDARQFVYRSAVDLWVAVLLLITPIVSFVLAGVLLGQGRGNDAITLLIVGGVRH